MNKDILSWMGLLAALTISGSAQGPFPNRCSDGRPLAFAAIAVAHPIDQSCGLKGKPSSGTNSQLQNSVKNNFCARNVGNAPETVTPQSLITLQNSHHFPSGFGQEPATRTALQAAGEGKLVRMKAFLIEAHNADLGTGESVNCSLPNEDENDIHIAFGSQQNTPECGSVTGEISPHFRPASWNEIGHFERFDNATKKFIVDPAMAARLQAHPYRITGQRFFDASHAPCPCSATTCDHNPVRSSLWEIHPIYNIEVCKAGTNCDENNDTNWISFDTWWKSLTPIQPVRQPHTHEPHEPPTP